MKTLSWWIEDTWRGLLWHLDRRARPWMIFARYVRTVSFAEEPGVFEQEVVFEEEISRHWTRPHWGTLERIRKERPDVEISVVDLRRSDW